MNNVAYLHDHVRSEPACENHGANSGKSNEWRQHGAFNDAGKPFSDPMAQNGLKRQLNRVWWPHLSMAERCLATFVIDRTLDWIDQKEERYFTYRFIVNGDNFCSGAGIQRTAAVAAVKSLRAKGLISVETPDPKSPERNKGMRIRFNADWNPPTPEPVKPVATTIVRMRQRPSDRTSLEPDAIARTLVRAISSHEEWVGLHGERWPNEERYGVALCLSENWHKTKESPEAAHEFADWLVLHWPEIRQRHDAPAYPAPEFVSTRHRWLLANWRCHKSSGNEPPLRKT